MRRRVKSDGLTVTEAVLLVLVCLFAMAVIVPMLARVRSVPNRITCGTRLAGLGKAMLLYSCDYEDHLPRAGARDSSWAARTPNWLGKDRREAFGISPEGTGGQASVSASLYLLVKYTEITPKQFLCVDRKGRIEKGASEFRPAAYGVSDGQLVYLWDFGPDPARHCSYAYQMVYSPHELIASAGSDMAIAGDRNPWMDAPVAKAREFSPFTPDLPPFNGTDDQARQGNSKRHDGDGQNVMFLDTHVNFEKRSNCGVEDDNIYTAWDGADRIRGQPPKIGSQPAGDTDSLLVNDPPAARE